MKAAFARRLRGRGGEDLRDTIIRQATEERG
jgi:hypothetical protein